MASSDLHFLATKHTREIEIAKTIKKDLPLVCEYVIEDGFITLDKNGDPYDKFTSRSENLKALASKLSYMISMGRGIDIKPMLESIVTGKVKVWDWHGNRLKRREKKKNYHEVEKTDNYWPNSDLWFIYGHFRHSKVGYVLTDRELERVREYFKL